MKEIPVQKPSQGSLGFIPQRISRQRQIQEQAAPVQEKPVTGSRFSLGNISISYHPSQQKTRAIPIIQQLNISQVQQKKNYSKIGYTNYT